MVDACVVLPTINEADNIAILIPALHYYLSSVPHEIVVVDDASTDGTPKVASELGAFVIERPMRLGLGSAIHAGVMHCIKSNALVAVVMDADLQHPPIAVPKLIKACVGGSDVCVGVRVGRESLPPHRRLVSRVAEFLGELAYGDGVPDLMSGFFAINLVTMRDYVMAFKPTPRNYKYLLEFLLFLKRHGVVPRTAAIPYRQLGRLSGSSKMGIGEIMTYLTTVLKHML